MSQRIGVIFADDKEENFVGIKIPNLELIHVDSEKREADTLSKEKMFEDWDRYVEEINFWEEVKSIIEAEMGENDAIFNKTKDFLERGIGNRGQNMEPIDLLSSLKQEQLEYITEKKNEMLETLDKVVIFLDWDQTVTRMYGFLNSWTAAKKTLRKRLFRDIDIETADRMTTQIFGVYYYGGRERYHQLRKWWNSIRETVSIKILTQNIQYKSIIDFMKETGFEIGDNDIIRSDMKMETIFCLQMEEERKMREREEITIMRTLSPISPSNSPRPTESVL